MNKPRLSYLEAVLTAIALLLGVLVIDRVGSVSSAQNSAGGPIRVPANAARPSASAASEPAAYVDDTSDPSGRVNASEQRKVMIAELRSLSAKVERLEQTISSGIRVKVTEMPPISLPSAQ